MPKNVGGDGRRSGRDGQRVNVAHNDDGRIHLQFDADLDAKDFCLNNMWVNMPDMVDTEVERQPVKILGWKLK